MKAQTQGPFAITPFSTDCTNAFNVFRGLLHLLPVYNATQPNTPQFLVLNLQANGLRIMAIDVSVTNRPSLSCIDFSLPPNMLVGTSLEPSCRNQEANKRLVIAGIVSSVFELAMEVFFVAW